MNGCIIGLLYDSGVKNLYAKTLSGVYHKIVQRFYTRSCGIYNHYAFVG